MYGVYVHDSRALDAHCMYAQVLLTWGRACMGMLPPATWLLGHLVTRMRVHGNEYHGHKGEQAQACSHYGVSGYGHSGWAPWLPGYQVTE